MKAIRKRAVVGVVIAVLAAGPPAHGQSGPSDPEVLRGLRQVDEGEYDAAIVILDGAARRLGSDARQTTETAYAYLYLGIAYLGKGHEATARARFRAALDRARDLDLNPAKFAPRVIEVFEAAKRESAVSPAAATGSPNPAPRVQKGRSRLPLVLLGLGGAGAAAVAVASGGGSGGVADSGSADPRTVTFTGQLTQFHSSDEYGVIVTGSGTLDATVRWNEDPASVSMYLATGTPSREIAQALQTGQRESRLSAPVSPGTYRVNVFYDSRGTATYTLTVVHP